MIAILSRDLGVGQVGAWVSYATIAAPMIAILSHREINVDPLLRWILYIIRRFANAVICRDPVVWIRLLTRRFEKLVSGTSSRLPVLSRGRSFADRRVSASQGD